MVLVRKCVTPILVFEVVGHDGVEVVKEEADLVGGAHTGFASLTHIGSIVARWGACPYPDSRRFPSFSPSIQGTIPPQAPIPQKPPFQPSRNSTVSCRIYKKGCPRKAVIPPYFGGRRDEKEVRATRSGRRCQWRDTFSQKWRYFTASRAIGQSRG